MLTINKQAITNPTITMEGTNVEGVGGGFDRMREVDDEERF